MMTDLLPEIRNAARALIVRRGQVLLLKKIGGERGERYALPGGGQDTGEALSDALRRECKEEIGAVIEVGDLIYFADFFKLRETQPPTRRHVLEFLFECRISDDYSPRNGQRPDKHQVDVVWADLQSIAQMPLFPQYLSQFIPRYQRSDQTRYLGTFHDHPIS